MKRYEWPVSRELYIGRVARMTRRLSRQTEAVMRALATDPAAWRYGYELGREVELKAGSLYPILMRLCDRGLLDSRWETDHPAGRPPRHLYRLTADGARVAAELGVAAPARRSSSGGLVRPRPVRSGP
jgi:DNA-binding PadR family transcriptional regulator